MTNGDNIRYNTQSGIAALLTIVIVGAATLVMAYSASLLGLGELDLGYTSGRGAEAFSIADGCMEETLRRIRLNTAYGTVGGQINLTVPNGTCEINVSVGNPSERIVNVLGSTTGGGYNKKIQAALTLSGNIITITSWEERSD